MRGSLQEKKTTEARQNCKRNNIKYTTYASRIKNGYTEDEAVNGAVAICECCGSEYRRFNKNQKYCSEECKHKKVLEQKRNYRLRKKENKICDIENGVGNLSKIYNRPLTPETKYLVNLWYREGDSVELIAYLLRRPVKVIEELICT